MRRFNWPLWAGFLLTLFAAFSYFAFFVWFPITRDFPWANLLLFLLAAILLVVAGACAVVRLDLQDQPPGEA